LMDGDFAAIHLGSDLSRHRIPRPATAGAKGTKQY